MADGLGATGRITAEEQAEGSISFKVWSSYFRSGTNIVVLMLMILVLVTSQVITSGSDFFVSFWTQQEYLRYLDLPTRFSTFDCLYIYAGFIVGVIIVSDSGYLTPYAT